jgi:hypothetical protein
MLKPTKTYTPDTPQISAEDLNTFGQVVRMVNGTAGPLSFQDADGVLTRKPFLPLGVIPIKISGFTVDGTLKRWFYTWHLPRKLISGYSTSAGPDDDAWSNTLEAIGGPSSTFGYAYNGAEEVNGMGTPPTSYGNGVTVADLVAVPALEIQPVTPGSIVLALIVYPEDGGLPEAWFNSPNGVSGAVECP